MSIEEALKKIVVSNRLLPKLALLFDGNFVSQYDFFFTFWHLLFIFSAATYTPQTNYC